MRQKLYLYEDIINNQNLLFDLKHDIIFRNVFLNDCSLDYVCKLFNYLLGYSYEELKKDLKIINNEHTSNSATSNIIRSDIIYKFNDIYIILEMNISDKEFHINKNYQYLFKQHSSRLNNKNRYKNKTILINIDNYNVLGKNDIIYKSNLFISKYYKCIYKYIDIIHINLDGIRRKLYNKDELSWIDKFLIIFIEQDKRKILSVINEREVIKIMEYMYGLDFKEGDPVTYNYQEAEKLRKEMALEHERELLEHESKLHEHENKLHEHESKLHEQENNLHERESKLKDKKLKIEAREKKLEEKQINLAKELKKAGFPLNRILEITELSKNKIISL